MCEQAVLAPGNIKDSSGYCARKKVSEEEEILTTWE